MTDKEDYEYLPIHHAVELENKKFKPPEWYIDRYIPKNSINVIGAKRSHHKTWLAMQMGLNIATGIPFLDKFPTKKSNVLYIDEEGGEPEFKRRLDMLMKGMGITKYPGNLSYMCLEGFQLDDDEWYEKLVNTLMNELFPCVVFVDTFRRVTNIEENDAGEVNRLLNKVRQLTKPTVQDEKRISDSTWIFLHHMRKNISGHNIEDRLDELRGSGDLAAGVDVALLLENSKAGNGIVLHQEKCRRWKCQEPYTLDIDEVEGESFKFIFSGTYADVLNDVDRCSEKIMAWVVEKAFDEFKTGDADKAMKKLKYPHATVGKALDKLLKKNVLRKPARGVWERIEGKYDSSTFK